MFSFVVKKASSFFSTILALATICFILLHTVPGGPFDSERPIPPDIQAQIAKKYHLDKPIYQQYLIYISDLLQADFGPSYKYPGRSVNDIIRDTLPISIELGLYAICFAIFFGLLFGILAAMRPRSYIDYSSMIIAVASISVPTYFISAIAIYIFCIYFKVLPAAFWDSWQSAILPTISLGVRPAALIARLIRASLLESIQSDYIRTARAKGLSETNIIWKHALKNSLLPVLSLMGPLTAYILTGTFVVEHIFSIPGSGKHFILAVSNRDYPLVMGLTIIFGSFLVIANFTIDLLYRFIDPRMEQNG